MEKVKIISQVKINGEWVDQDSVPPEIMQAIVEQTIRRAASAIGFDVVKESQEKTA